MSYRVTQVRGLAVGSGDNIRATQACALALVKQSTSNIRITALRVAWATHSPPNYDWDITFREVRFPEDIGLESSFAPKYAVDSTTVDSGAVSTRGRWSQSLHEYDLAYGLKSFEDLYTAISFLEAIGGPGIGFRFKDYLDFNSSGFSGREPIAVSATDMPLGTGDGETTQFQIIKTYTFGSETSTRVVTKPVSGTVKVAINSTEVSNFTVDTTTGVITFTPRHSVTGTDISFVDTGGGNWVIRSTSTNFSGFTTSDKIRVTGSNLNDTKNDDVYTITSVPGGAGDLAVSDTLITESAGASITVDVHPAPRSGDTLEHGFEFDVPVTFAKQTVSNTLENYRIGATSFPLVEIYIESAL